jgi:hypothetical protein
MIWKDQFFRLATVGLCACSRTLAALLSTSLGATTSARRQIAVAFPRVPFVLEISEPLQASVSIGETLPI